MAQVAKMCGIRGTLFTHTAKNLTTEQTKEVSDIMDIVWKQPEFQNGKYMFCMALARTIGNEYKNSDAGLSEVWLVLWKATVDALYHRPKKVLKTLIEGTCTNCKHQDVRRNGKGDIKVYGTNCTQCGSPRMAVDENFLSNDLDSAERLYIEVTGFPAPARDRTVVENPAVRKKFYQTILFNYLRQIIRENTFETAVTTTNIVGPADQVTIGIIKTMLERSNIEHEVSDKQGNFQFHMNTNMLPLDIIQQIAHIKETMEQHGIQIQIFDMAIAIKSDENVSVVSQDVTQKMRLKQLSFDTPTDDSESSASDQLLLEANTEEHVFNYDDIDWSDAISVVKNRLPADAQKVYDLILHQPPEYVAQFGSGVVKRAHAARFLNISTKEINRIWDIIELQMRAICLTPDFC